MRARSTHASIPFRSGALVVLLLLSTTVARAEDFAAAADRVPAIPPVETAAEDLAVLTAGHAEAQPARRAPTDPGARADEDRDLPPARPRPGHDVPRIDEPAVPTVLERFAAKPAGTDTAGGDDRLVLTSPSIRGYEMEIAQNGDIYLAVAHVPAGSPVRIDVFRSRDGGDSWQVWGSRASATYHYDRPALHLAEGPNARLFLAYNFYADGGGDDDAGVIVASTELDAVDWTLALGFWVPTSSFRRPDITTDHLAWNDYRVYLTASEYDAEGSSDIWFAVSSDRGQSFDGYEIGTLSAEAHYWSPRVAVGWGGVVHVAWYIYFSNFDIPLNNAIRYRQASNRAFAGVGAWSPTLAITSSSGPEDCRLPSVAAQATNENVALTYYRDGDSVLRVSDDAGATWRTDDAWTLDGPYLPTVAAGPGRFIITGRRYPDSSYGFTTVADTQPGRPAVHEILADESYSSLIGTPGAIVHPSPVRGDRFALAWMSENAYGDDDQLFFDAEWRADPGYPNHHDSFPLALTAQPATPPAIVDVDGDGRSNEIVFADANGDVHVVDRNGAELPGFPVSTHQTIADESLAVGDLDGDGKQEIVVGTTNGRVYAFHADGSAVFGWPVGVGSTLPAHVSIGTVSRLSKRDVVVTAGRQLHLLRPNGTAHESGAFPVFLSDQVHAAAAIGDLGGDGRAEIVLVAGENVHVFDADAQPVFTRTLVGTDLRNTPSLGDLDFDGTLEVVVPTDRGEVWVLEHDGTVRPGWPYDIGSDDIIQEVALADFAVSLENVLDLAFAQRGNRVHARATDGWALPGWPRDTSAGWFLLGGPIVAGLNQTVDSEVAIGDRGNLVHGWLGWQFGMTGWPKDVEAKVNLSPAAGDIDADGLNELVVLTHDALVVLDVNGTPVNDRTRRWPMYGYDPQRTSCAACPVDVVTSVEPGSDTTQLLAFAPPHPNPSSGNTTFRYRLPQRAVVRLEIYDARGRLVRSVLKAEQGAGEHVVAWNGRDDLARDVGNGQYFGRLQVEGDGYGESVTRKIVVTR